MSRTLSSGILFVSERCVYCEELLSQCNVFRPDLTLTVICVDNPDKKTTRLIDAYSVDGVPTLVVDNEKHSEGIDVFNILLKTKRSARPQPHSKRVVTDEGGHNGQKSGGLAPISEQTPLDYIGFIGSEADLGAPLDFETPECSRDATVDSASQLDSRLKEIEDMRKQSDENAKMMNQTLSDRKMMTTRQMEYDDELS